VRARGVCVHVLEEEAAIKLRNRKQKESNGVGAKKCE
jgi:hypothetical protein